MLLSYVQKTGRDLGYKTRKYVDEQEIVRWFEFGDYSIQGDETVS